MEKKQYIQPKIEVVRLKLEKLMITASPGVGGDYDPTLPIDAKPGFFDEEEEDGSLGTSEGRWNLLEK